MRLLGGSLKVVHLLPLCLLVLNVPMAQAEDPPPFILQWGSRGFGDGQFNDAGGVAVDGTGNVYVADFLNHRVQKFTNSGAFITKWNSGALFVAVDGTGNVYVTDYNDRVRKYTNSGAFLTEWGSYGSGDGQFDHSYAIDVDGTGNVYVTDYNNHRVQKFTSNGAFLTKWGSYGTGDGQFNVPGGVAVDGTGNVYVSDGGNHRIQKFTSTGAFLGKWGSYGSGDGQFNFPQDVALDDAGNIYVSEYEGHRIQKFTNSGAFLTKWGSYGSGDGQFNKPAGVAVDGIGNVYVADVLNWRIQKFGPSATPSIAMGFDFTPSTLNLAGRSLWVTGFLEPPSPFAASDIDIESIRLNGTVPVDPAAPTAIGDHNGNGVPDLMVRFDRAAVELTVAEGENIPVTVTGTVDGRSFSGTDYIRVRRAKVSHPLAGSHLTTGSVTPVRWEMPSGVTVESVALLFSPDGGTTWNLITRGQPSTGSYDWTVPNVQTSQAKVAVVLVESADETGVNVDGVLGVSEAFSIEAVVGVGDRGRGEIALAIRAATPNPAVGGRLWVEFSLRDGSPAKLELIDVAGRGVSARQVGSLGAGNHALDLSDGEALAPGIYFLRLTQGGTEVRARAAVIK